MPKLSDIIVRFGADDGPLMKAIDRVKKGASSLVDKFRNVGAALGLSLGAGGIVVTLNNIAKELDRIGQSAGKLGISTEELSKLEFAASQSGIAADTLGDVLATLQERISESKEATGTAREEFDALGLSYEDLINLPLEQQFKRFAEAWAAIPNQTERTRILISLLGDEALNFANLMDEGSVKIDKYGEAFERMGGAISKETTENAREFMQVMNEFNAAADVLSQKLGGVVIPKLTQSMIFLNALFSGEGFGGAVARMRGQIEQISPAIDAVDASIRRIKDNLKGETSFLEEWLGIGIIKRTFGKTKGELLSELYSLERERERLVEEANSREEARGQRLVEFEKKRQQALTSVQKEELKKREEAQKESLKQRQSLLQQYVSQAQSLIETEKSLIEQISKAGTPEKGLEERVQLGKELDVGDLFIRMNEAFSELSGGNVDKAEQNIEDITGAMDLLSERGRINLITLQQLREGLTQLAKEITTSKIEKLGEDVTKKGKGEEQVLDVRINKESINAQLKAVLDKGIDLPVRPYLVEDTGLIEQAVAKQANQAGGHP